MPRAPRQERAKHTVEAIVDAGFLCLAERGQVATTTHHIAEKAGVGVGSVYEYFDNKDAIFKAMTRRIVDDTLVMLKEVTAEARALEAEGAIRLLLDRFNALLCRDSNRYLNAAHHVFRAEDAPERHELGQALMQALTDYLMAKPQYTRVPDLQTMSYIFIHGGMFVVLRHLSSECPPFSFDQLRDGLARLVASYFRQQW